MTLPETLTATRLREIADELDGMGWRTNLAHLRDLRGWADWLDAQPAGIKRPLTRVDLIETITETDRVFPESWEWEQVRASAERLADALIARLDAQPAPSPNIPPGMTSEEWDDWCETEGGTAQRTADAQLADPQPASDQEIALREAVEHALVIADGAVAVTDERPSDEWRAAFVANLFVGDAHPADPQPAAELKRTVRAMVEDGHPCGSRAADEWFGILRQRLESPPAVSGRVTPTREAR